MIKEIWQDCNLLQKIMMVVLTLSFIMVHILAIYGLIDVEWAAENAISPILGRVLLVILLILSVAFDTMLIATELLLGD